MRAAVWDAPGALRLTDIAEPVPGDGQVLLEVACCGVCGSDLHALASGYLIGPGQVLGHEVSGRVLAAPGVPGLREGQRVAVRPVVPCGACEPCRTGDVQGCDAPVDRFIGLGEPGGFAEKVLVPIAVTGGTVFPLPDAVDDRAGALVEPLAVALHAVGMAGAVAGATALVLGAGMIGLGVVRLLRLAGAATIVVADPSPLRRVRAGSLGADVVIDPAEQDAVAAVRAITGPWARDRGARADVVVDCAGAPGTFAAALDAAGQGATVVVAAMGATRAELRPDLLAMKELVVRGSLIYRHEFPAVIDLLADASLAADDFVSHVLPLEQISEAFAVQRDADASLKVLVSPLGASG
jgi:(R,R)-butanediol dehydrogenase/meso-butanediol dehydrogenase/diacetyl reductase